MKLTLMRECYSVSRSLIDENNGSAGRSLIVLHHGMAPKFTSAAEIQLLFKERPFTSSSLYFSYVVFIGITTTRLRTFRLRHFVYRHFVCRYFVYYDFPS